MTSTMALHSFIWDSHNEDHDFAYWEAVEEYEHHGDQVVENDDEDNDGGILYIRASDSDVGCTWFYHWSVSGKAYTFILALWSVWYLILSLLSRSKECMLEFIDSYCKRKLV